MIEIQYPQKRNERQASARFLVTLRDLAATEPQHKATEQPQCCKGKSRRFRDTRRRYIGPRCANKKVIHQIRTTRARLGFEPYIVYRCRCDT